MFKLITIAAAMIACVAAAPGYASLGHGSYLGSPLALSAPISYAAPIAKIAAPISYAAPIAKIAAPAYAPYGGYLGSPIAKIGAPLSLGYGSLGYGGLGLGHGIGGPIW